MRSYRKTEYVTLNQHEPTTIRYKGVSENGECQNGHLHRKEFIKWLRYHCSVQTETSLLPLKGQIKRRIAPVMACGNVWQSRTVKMGEHRHHDRFLIALFNLHGLKTMGMRMTKQKRTQPHRPVKLPLEGAPSRTQGFRNPQAMQVDDICLSPAWVAWAEN